MRKLHKMSNLKIIDSSVIYIINVFRLPCANSIPTYNGYRLFFYIRVSFKLQLKMKHLLNCI